MVFVAKHRETVPEPDILADRESFVTHSMSQAEPAAPARRPRRVAQVARAFLHRTETFLYTYATGLEGWDVHVICEERRHPELFPFDEARIHSREECSWPSLRERGYAWLSNRERLGLWRHFDTRRPFVACVLRRLQPELVHAQFGWQGAWIHEECARLGIPLITSFYGLDLSELAKRPRYRSSYASLFEKGTLFLTEGPAMEDTLVELGCPRAKIRRQILGIDTERFAFREPRRPNGPLRLIQIASLREKKGHATLLRACAQLRERGVAFELRLVGSGKLETELRQLTQELELDQHVQWLGSRTHDECAELLGDSHIFVHPSVLAADGDREGGAPTILLEAQARGLPIVATQHDDIPFFVRANETGLLVPERDPAALADALAELAASPERWPTMARAGRAHVEARFSKERALSMLRQNYDEALSLGRLS
jgi:colanic acid/amylovoran biosynthesis glycosyltransferase